MGTTSQKLTYLNDTKTQLKDMINYGLDTGEKITSETTFRNYVKSLFDAFIKTMTYPDVLYNNLPKVTGEGTSLTLNDTVYAPMRVELSPSALEQETSILPSEYTQVDYIENSGTQYIDTGFIPDYDKDIKIEIETTPTVSNTRYCLLSNYSVPKHLSLEIHTANAGRAYWNNGQVDKMLGSLSASDKNTYIFEYDATNKKYNFNVNGVTANGNMAAEGVCTSSLLMFIDQANRFSTFTNPLKMYRVKITENDVLIRNFIPCYRNSDNEIGMYDLVNDVFYTNQGTGTFTKGSNSVLPNPDYPQQIHTVSGENSVKVVNKNLFDEEYYNNDSLYQLNVYKYVLTKIKGNRTLYTKCVLKENKTSISGLYMLICSQNNPNLHPHIDSWLVNNGNVIASSNNDFTGVNDIYFTYYPTTVSLQDIFDTYNIMVSTTDEEYEAFSEDDYNVNLGNLEYCKIGDYEDEFYKATESDTGLTAGKWYLKKNTIKRFLKDFNFTRSVLSSGNILFSIDLNYYGNASSVNVLSSHFLGTTDNQGNILNSIRLNVGHNCYIVMEDNEISETATTFKNWCDTNNVYAYFKLPTPTYTLLSDTLQTQLDNLQKAISYQDKTNVSQTNNDLPFVISASAIRDYE